MTLTISAYSTARFSTWYFIEEYGILFDAGDGLVASLLNKSRKIKHIFVSHADRDHLTGLLQLNQLAPEPNYPTIYYPKDCGSFPVLAKFIESFNPHIGGSAWIPVIDRMEMSIHPNLIVQAIKNNHVQTEVPLDKSLGFKVFETKKKLRKSFSHLNENEVRELIFSKGKDMVLEEVRTNVLSYSGDTPIDNFEKWDGSEILIHEATFLSKKDHAEITTRGNAHSNLEAVLEAVGRLSIGKLILGHFSSRYSTQTIDDEIRKYCKHFSIQIPVYRIRPGHTTYDIFGTDPLN